MTDFIFQELLTSSTKFYDEMETTFQNYHKYLPSVFRPDYENTLQTILTHNQKTIIASNSSAVESAVLADYLLTNKNI